MRRPPLTLVLSIAAAWTVLVGLVVWLPPNRATTLATLVSAVGACLAALRGPSSGPRGPRRRRR